MDAARSPEPIRPTPAHRPGRPLDPAKHERILRAATRAFLDAGFQATSMDHVAREAGVSKVTVYSHFKSKEGLFGAIIDEMAQRLVGRIDRFALGDVSPEAALREVGRRYLELALATSTLTLHRLVVAESARFKRLGQEIYRNGPTQVVGGLADFLRRQKTLKIDDPHLAAEQFFGMVLGHAQIRLLLGARPAREVRGGIARSVDHAVEIFLRGTAR
jgi:TetR/AcrR family transcriptional regulator, mexJK operon transcriptional repressor